MRFLIEQTLSKPTVQFGLRTGDYIALLVVGIVGNFFLTRLWLVTLMISLVLLLRYVNIAKPRYFWSSWFLWLSNTNLSQQQEQQLPPLIHREVSGNATQ
jgi:hypothetical protein